MLIVRKVGDCAEGGNVRVVWHDKEVMKKIDKEVAKDAEKAARLVLRSARHTTLFKDRKGTLRKSMRVIKSKFKGGGFLVVAGGRGFWGDAWYAAKVHLGYRPKGGGHVSPRPFLWRAVDANRRFIKAAFKKR